MNDKLKIIFKEYTIITLSILAMAIGIYFFKFPYNFAFGGVTGYATMIGALTNLTATRFSNIANMVLLVVGFICIGKSFGIKTIYASIELTIILELLERFVPLSGPLTDQPFLEMVLDILAMILKKYTKSNELGIMFIAVDVLAVIMSFFVFDIKTGLFSALGLVGKSFIIDGAIESINLCKCFTIVCDTPEPICEYIINNLHRSATIYEAKGAFAHNKKTIILTTMKRSQAVKLRNYIKRIDPSSFMMITNSSEIIGKGFQNV